MTNRVVDSVCVRLAVAVVTFLFLSGLGAGAAVAGDSGNFTFFLISDIHFGASNPKANPPVTPEQIELKVLGVVSNMVAVAQKPFSNRGSFKDLEMGAAGPVKGVFIDGDITDHGAAAYAGCHTLRRLEFDSLEVSDRESGN